MSILRPTLITIDHSTSDSSVKVREDTWAIIKGLNHPGRVAFDLHPNWYLNSSAKWLEIQTVQPFMLSMHIFPMLSWNKQTFGYGGNLRKDSKCVYIHKETEFLL